MKKIYLMLAIVFSNCTIFGQLWKDSDKLMSGYIIEGTIQEDYSGKVYLVREEAWKGKQVVIDSCEVVDGKYEFKGDSVETVMVHFIKSRDGQLLPFFLENGRIKATCNASNFYWGTVTGTATNDLRDFYKYQIRYIQDSVTKAAVIDWNLYGRKDMETESKEYDRRSKLIAQRNLEVQRAMVTKYSDQVFAPFLIYTEMIGDMTLEEIKALRANLSPSLNENPYTKALDEFIEAQSFKVGVQAYDFTLPTIDGKQISLKDYAGKYVFLDFWASWCGPCRREIPYVAQLYKKYKKEVEVIGISVDRDEKKWKDAVKENKMNWIQCCDLKEWNSIVCKKYNVRAIPRTVLIDPQGKVVAIDLRGARLLEEVAKYIKEK